MLITAWAFGTSPGMDSFHMATGIIALFAGSVGVAMESAILPELEHLRKKNDGSDHDKQVVAIVAWLLMFFVLLLCIVFALFPEHLIKFFAKGFDPERVRIGALMLWWLMPFTVVMVYKPILDVWALFTERYTLSSLCAVIFNFIAIPALLILVPLIGVYAVAGSMSLGHSVSFLLFFIFLGGVPLRIKFSSLPIASLGKIAKNASYALIITAASTIYVMVDRYFASGLPSGSVSAISYGNTILAIVSLAAATPLGFFLAKISRIVVEDREEGEHIVRQTLAIVVGYFLPVGFFLAAAAKPVVSLIYGWGNFDVQSVYMTSISLSAYALGLVFSICVMIIYRYTQALQNLGFIVVLSYVFILTNAFLDWLLVRYYGLFGLALATSITQMLSFIAYYMIVMKQSLFVFLIDIKFFPQLIAVTFCALLAWWCSRFGTIVHLSAATLIAVLYIFGAERYGLMQSIPEHWRPTKLILFIWEGMGTFLRSRKSRD